MKRALLLMTSIACLSTTGAAVVLADNPSSPAGPEAQRGLGGTKADMDAVGSENYQGGEGGEAFRQLDRNHDGFLNSQELNAYGAPSAGTRSGERSGGAELVQQLDSDDDNVVTPEEFRKLQGEGETP